MPIVAAVQLMNYYAVWPSDNLLRWANSIRADIIFFGGPWLVLRPVERASKLPVCERARLYSQAFVTLGIHQSLSTIFVVMRGVCVCAAIVFVSFYSIIMINAFGLMVSGCIFGHITSMYYQANRMLWLRHRHTDTHTQQSQQRGQMVRNARKKYEKTIFVRMKNEIVRKHDHESVFDSFFTHIRRSQ